MKKITLICLTCILSITQALAQYRQDIANTPPGDAIDAYMGAVKEYAAVYNGIEQIPYPAHLLNHPYLNTSGFVSGTIGYNGVLYKDIPMRLDMFREELIVRSTDKPFNIVLEYEKLDYAQIGESTVLSSYNKSWQNRPSGKYFVLLYENQHTVLKQYVVSYVERINRTGVEASFKIQERYYICKDGTMYPVKNKKTVLSVFADRKEELGKYIREHKLKFGKQPGQAIIAIVEQYENLSK
jgi:hypothetical protein